jgi:hypothetical protein
VALSEPQKTTKITNKTSDLCFLCIAVTTV